MKERKITTVKLYYMGFEMQSSVVNPLKEFGIDISENSREFGMFGTELEVLFAIDLPRQKTVALLKTLPYANCLIVETFKRVEVYINPHNMDFKKFLDEYQKDTYVRTEETSQEIKEEILKYLKGATTLKEGLHIMKILKTLSSDDAIRDCIEEIKRDVNSVSTETSLMLSFLA